MYRIGDILEQALLLHDCVVLPTIGAFIVEQTPPLYDKDLNVITPAGQRISFNASLVAVSYTHLCVNRLSDGSVLCTGHSARSL